MESSVAIYLELECGPIQQKLFYLFWIVSLRPILIVSQLIKVVVVLVVVVGFVMVVVLFVIVVVVVVLVIDDIVVGVVVIVIIVDPRKPTLKLGQNRISSSSNIDFLCLFLLS